MEICSTDDQMLSSEQRSSAIVSSRSRRGKIIETGREYGEELQSFHEETIQQWPSYESLFYRRRWQITRQHYTFGSRRCGSVGSTNTNPTRFRFHLNHVGFVYAISRDPSPKDLVIALCRIESRRKLLCRCHRTSSENPHREQEITVLSDTSSTRNCLAHHYWR